MSKLMTNENVRVYPHDRLLNAFMIRFIPRQVQPNHLTILRFVLIPFVLWYVHIELWSVAVPLFIFAAFTDALDGSLARLRKQITRWGTFADPAADKLLIGSVAILFVARQIHPAFAIIIVCSELLILTTGLIRGKKRLVISANWAGKIKMLLQVIGVALLLIAKWTGIAFLTPLAVAVLVLAILFAIVSFLTYSL